MTDINDKPICIFMAGVPYSGKSTFIANNPWLAKMPCVSLDREVFKLTDGDYSKWADCITHANALCEAFQDELIENRASFVIDKTNLSHAVREALIVRLRQRGYQVAAIVFEPPDKTTLRERVKQRKGQVVPAEVLAKMRRTFEADKEWLAQEFEAVVWVSGSGKIR